MHGTGHPPPWLGRATSRHERFCSNYLLAEVTTPSKRGRRWHRKKAIYIFPDPECSAARFRCGRTSHVTAWAAADVANTTPVAGELCKRTAKRPRQTAPRRARPSYYA
jgi:hypothetical protein